MSDYSLKLSALKAEEDKLREKKEKLIEKRKQEIADLAERFGLLIISNEVLAGVFSQVEHAIKTDNSRLDEWEKLGETFLKARKQNTSSTQASASPTSKTE